MFNINEIKFGKLKSLKDKLKLEIELYIYEEIYLEKLYYCEIKKNDEAVGVIILKKYQNGIFIEYFEIVKSQRNMGLGSNFITYLKSELKSNIYLVPLPTSENFWRKCEAYSSPNIWPIHVINE